MIAAFEKSTVVSYPGDSIGGAIGQTMPIWKSDDNGTSWQPLSEVAPPSKLSADPAVAKRVFAAMMTMQKIDVATIEAARRGERVDA